MTYSLIRKAGEVAGFTHGELAQILGVSRQLVQKICADATPEYLSARQTQALFAAVRLAIDRMEQGLTEMEKRI